MKAVALYGGAEIVPYGGIADETGKQVGLVVSAWAPGAQEHRTLAPRLSSIYSNRYIVATKDLVGGAVKQMRFRPDPFLARLALTAQTRVPGRCLRVQVGTMHPDPPEHRQPNRW